ncbi:MAG: DUF4234 domain-containing protein [Nanoarchaeota archaeon]
MPKITEYYCTKCGRQIRQGTGRCPKCKSLLAADGAVRSKIVEVSEARAKIIEDVYQDNFKYVSELTEKEKEEYKKHKILKPFHPALAVLLSLITFGIFALVYYGKIHGKLPRINEDDPTVNKAIGYYLIPVYNIYWQFKFWLNITDRINFQYKLRNKEVPKNRTFVKTTLICSVIPGVWYSAIILFPMTIAKVQNAINGLTDKPI